MKKTIRLALITASLATASQAAPFMAIGDSAELFLTGSLGVRYDDNIFLAKSKTNDTIFNITPGLELDFGKNSQLQGSLTLNYSWETYSDNSNLNTDLLGSDFVSKYDDGKMKLGFNAGYHELNQNNADVRVANGLVRRDIFSLGANGEVEISQITAVGAAISYNNENYKRVGYTDSESVTIPLNFYYKWTPKVDLSVGYTYTDYSVDFGQDSKDHFFNVGARGEFSPKFTGKLAVGLLTRKLDGADPTTGKRGGDESTFGIDSSFSYEVTPKTSLQFGASNMYGTSPQGQQQRNLTVNGMVMTKIDEQWSVNAGLSWRSIDYFTRTDDYYELTLGGTYVVSSNIRIIGGYTYRQYDSDISASEFKNNVFSISAFLRY